MEWSFGQIVAICIWLPTLFSLFNDCKYGPLQGRTNQLPPGLHIVRTNSLVSHSAHASAQDIAQSGTDSLPSSPVAIMNTVVSHLAPSSVELLVFSFGANEPQTEPVSLSITPGPINGGSV